MAEITGRYTFHGLLATISPEVWFGQRRSVLPGGVEHMEPGWVLTIMITVPDRQNGEPFGVADIFDWESEPAQDEVDAKVLERFESLLEHEAREGLRVNGRLLCDEHARDE